MSLELDAWSVVVTGAAGLIGRVLCATLARQGAAVIAVDAAGLGEPDGTAAGLRLWSGDAAALPSWNSLAEGTPDAPRRGVVHLAGWADAGRCAADPEGAYAANVRLVEVVRAWAARQGCASFLLPSTGYVYGDALGRAATEADAVPEPEACENVYVRTKLLAEQALRAAAADRTDRTDAAGGDGASSRAGPGRTSAMRRVVARLSNVYGPRSGENTVVGRTLAAVRQGRAPVLRDLTPVRDFIHVDDVGEGMARLLTMEPAKPAAAPDQALDHGPDRTSDCASGRVADATEYEAFNLSTGVATPIGDLAAAACEAAGITWPPLGAEPAARDGAQERTDHAPPRSYLVLRNDRLRARLGWTPRMNLCAGLRQCLGVPTA